MQKSDPVSIRLHPTLEGVVRNKAADLQTTVTWIVEAALADYFRDQLPPDFRPGMPWKRSS